MIINSLLDTDLYKLTMMQAVFHQFPAAEVEYEFRNRSSTLGHVDQEIVPKLERELDILCSLSFQEQELEYLSKLKFIKPSFINFLRLFRLDRKAISVEFKNGLNIKIKGSWLHTILFEVPVLALVNQLYYESMGWTPAQSSDTRKWGQENLARKIEKVNQYRNGFLFTDFGTRRRISREWQDHVVSTLARELPANFIGTSNVALAKKLNITPIGTMAHEWLQAMQVMVPVSESQKFAFQKWADEYRGDLGIALSDVVGFDAFLRDFDLYFCKLYDGARHDSGDPYAWAEKLIAHYQSMRIDPKTKRAVFSDGLTIAIALDLHRKFHDRIEMGFGIGTHLTNDCGVKPLNIVIKMTSCNGRPVAKISDAPGKTICQDEQFLAYLKSAFKIA